MRERFRGRGLSTALAGLLGCAVLLPLLGRRPLTEWDEGIYAEIAREMLKGDWLTPHWNGQVWLEKPPLMFWVTAVFYKLFGVTEFWARAASALSGAGLVALVHGWLFPRYGRRAAWVGSLLLMANFGFLHACHTGEVDVLLSLGCAVALCGLVRVEEETRFGWVVFFSGAAVAVLTKGAAAVTLVPVVAIVAAWNRWGSRRFGVEFAAGLTGFLAVVLPWPVVMLRRYGRGFVGEFLGKHVLTRASTQMEGHVTHWWFYLWVLLVSAAPFVVFYPAAVMAALRRRELRVWATFAVVTVLMFSAAGTRLPHYIEPAYPALTIVTAVWLDRRLAGWLRVKRSMARWLTYGVSAAALCGVAVAVTASGRSGLHTAKLADGTVLPDSKESTGLLKRLKGQSYGEACRGGGLLLYWREGRISSIATAIFYSRREVQQVRLEALPADVVRDRYALNPEPLAEAVTVKPRLILLDRALVARIPPGFGYQPLVTGPTMEVGTIQVLSRGR